MTDTIANPRAPEETILTIGDTVRLKSGGHLMTIIGTAEDRVECVWSVRDDCKTKKFPVAALVSDASSRSALNVARSIAFVLREELAVDGE